MRFPTFPLALFAALILAFSAQAATYKTPQALIKAIYAYNIDNTRNDAPTPYEPFFSDGLNALFQADRDNTPDGDVGAIDFDPVISGQDGEATHVQPGTPIIIGKAAELEVTFTNGEPVTLYYTLVREHGGWKVDDIAHQQGEYPWSLRDLLTPKQ